MNACFNDMTSIYDKLLWDAQQPFEHSILETKGPVNQLNAVFCCLYPYDHKRTEKWTLQVHGHRS